MQVGVSVEARQGHRKSARVRVVPPWTVEGRAVPRYVLQAAFVQRAIEELVAPDRWMHLPETNHVSTESEQVGVPVHQSPVEPADLVILAICVVVTLL